MITDLKLIQGDIAFTSPGQPEWIANPQEVTEQIVENVLGMFTGEWFLDETRGVNWYRIFTNRLTKNQIIQELTRALLKSVVVDRVIDISVRTINRKAIIYVTIIHSGEKLSFALEV